MVIPHDPIWWGESHLDIANNKKSITILKLLICEGQHTFTKKTLNKTLLRSIERGKLNSVKLLLAAGARCSLNPAVESGNIEIVRALIALGRDVNNRGYCGETPLFIAAEEGYCEIAELLLEHKANIEAKNDYGWSPLKRAANHNHFKMVKLLLAHGADIRSAETSNSKLGNLFLNGHYDERSCFISEKMWEAMKSYHATLPQKENSADETAVNTISTPAQIGFGDRTHSLFTQLPGKMMSHQPNAFSANFDDECEEDENTLSSL